MSGAEERLREWLVQLSHLIYDDNEALPEDASLEEGLEWFTSLPDEALSELQNLKIPEITAFLEAGPELMRQVQR